MIEHQYSGNHDHGLAKPTAGSSTWLPRLQYSGGLISCRNDRTDHEKLYLLYGDVPAGHVIGFETPGGQYCPEPQPPHASHGKVVSPCVSRKLQTEQTEQTEI